MDRCRSIRHRPATPAFLQAVAHIVCCSLIAAASAHAQGIPGCELLLLGFERAQTPRLSAAQTQLREGPAILIESLRRGFDDGRSSTCSDAGVISLVINPEDVGPTDVYSFEVASGVLPDGLLPDGYVRPIEFSGGRHGFRFYWLDLADRQADLAPLSAVIRISRVSFAGERSEPMLLPIIDAGGAPARTSQIWNSAIVWIVVAIVMLLYLSVRMKIFRLPGKRRDELAAIQARLRVLADEKRAEKKRREGD